MSKIGQAILGTLLLVIGIYNGADAGWISWPSLAVLVGLVLLANAYTKADGRSG